jgi:hypothetical protein
MTFGLRHEQTDVLGSAWQKLLLGAALCLPVPTFAVSGLAVPLPTAIYRAGIGILEQTQAFTQAFAPLGDDVEPTRLLAPPTEEKERSFTAAPRRSTKSSRAAAAGRATVIASVVPTSARRRLPVRKHPRAMSRSSRRGEVLYTFESEPTRAPGEGAPEILFSSGPAASGEPKEHVPDKESTPTRTEQPARAEQPTKDEAPTRTEQPERNDPTPRDDPSPSERHTSPPAVLAPPPAEGTNLAPEPPVSESKSAREMLRALARDNPGSSLGSKAEDALDKLNKADVELAKTPPDLRAALNNIEDAVGDVEAAVEHGLLAAARGNTIMAILADEARSLAESAIGAAISGGGDVTKIVLAEERLAEGDLHFAAGAYKVAVSRYRDALSKAESA